MKWGWRDVDSSLDRFDRLARLAEVCCTRGGLEALVRWHPFSVAAFRLVQGLAREGLTFESVIDVGANVGKFSRAAVGMWPDAKVLAFEPLPGAAHQLSRSDWTHRHEIHAVALGARDGTITFYPHDYSLASSALPVPREVQGNRGWARESESIEVPVRRLDGILAGRTLSPPVLMKLDVQGYELEVLAGSRSTLEMVNALVIEQSFESVYLGQPLFGKSHRYLEAAGWRLARPLDWRRERGRILEVDCLYLPK